MSEWDEVYEEYPDKEYPDTCVYCGEELSDLNIVHYEINPETCETKILAINPMPHNKFMDNLRIGFVHRIELVCDDCLKEDFDM